MSFLLVKYLHVGSAALSLLGFLVRGAWMLRASPLLERRWVRIAPHAVDTLLLVTGLVMVIAYRFYPTTQPWLVAKLVALIAYVVLGSIALRRGRTRAIQTLSFALALAVFGYIVAVAHTHDPLPLG